MVEVTEVSATYSRTVQLEQYEPLKISETIVGTLEDGEDPSDAYDELYQAARDDVERKLTHRLATKKMEDDRGEEE